MGLGVLHRPRRSSLAFCVGVLLWCNGGLARETTDATSRAGTASADQATRESTTPPVRIGAIGGVGFPRPLAVEGMAVIDGVVALGGEYGVLPATSIDGVRVSLWSLSGDARVFPFRGAFFIGLRAGYQHLDASTVVVRSISATETLALDSWVINPRLGFLWILPNGLAWGVEAGVQFPVEMAISSALPLSRIPSAQSTADTLGNGVIPTVDLLRIGLVM
jgi:hypothetical protein